MYIAIGDPRGSNQSISMGMVHPFGDYFFEDNVFVLSSSALSKALFSPVHMCLGRVPGLFSVSIACTTTIPSHMQPTNNGQHFPYSFRTPLSWSLFSIVNLGLIQELHEIPHSDRPLNLIVECNTPLSIMPYVLMDGTILLEIPLWPITLHSLRLSVQVLVHHCVDMIYQHLVPISHEPTPF